MIDNFNAQHFPYCLEFVDDKLILSKYLLDSVIVEDSEDIVLEDCLKKYILSISGETKEDMIDTFSKIKYNYKK